MAYNRLSTSDDNSVYTDKSAGKDSSSSSEPFLENGEDSIGFDGRSTAYKRRDLLRAVVIHSLIFMVYSLGLLGVTRLFTPQGPPELTFTPAHGSVVYEKTWYDGSLGNTGRFIGEPRPELEEAWHELTNNNNLRFTKKELQSLGKDAIELADGSGYFGQLMVYHHLHCLKFLRESIYPEAYEGSTKEHLNHCIDDIRQALMCNPDTSASTFVWEDGLRRPQPDFKLYKTCVNWDLFNEWATERQFSMFDQKSLINPVYGIAFPLINGSIEYTPPGPGMHIVWPEEGNSAQGEN